jgi:hypothetical protein
MENIINQNNIILNIVESFKSENRYDRIRPGTHVPGSKRTALFYGNVKRAV